MSRPSSILVPLGLLAAALAGTLVLDRSFEFIPGPDALVYQAPEPPDFDPGPPVETPSRGVTFVLTDGLRLDVSRTMPEYQALAARGVHVETRALFPTFTRNGVATMMTGAGPTAHGYLANRNRRGSRMPSVADLADRAGIPTCAFWEGERIPSVFPRLDGHTRPLEIGLLPATGRHFTFVYLAEPDLVAHRLGGASEAYRAEALRVDARIGEIARTIDLSAETMIVATDHGHLDQGGHGGHEEVVVRIPLVLVGAGVKRGVRIEDASSDLRDVAPTVSALLGLRLPPWTTGRPLREALDFPPPFDRERQPLPTDPVPMALARAMGTAALLAAAPFLLLRPRGRSSFALAAAAVACFAGLYLALGRPLSFSPANTEAEVPRLVLEMAACAAIPFVALHRLAPDRRSFVAAVLTLAAFLSGALAGWVGFRAPTALDHPFTAYLAGLAMVELAVASLLALALAIFRR